MIPGTFRDLAPLAIGMNVLNDITSAASWQRRGCLSRPVAVLEIARQSAHPVAVCVFTVGLLALAVAPLAIACNRNR